MVERAKREELRAFHVTTDAGSALVELLAALRILLNRSVRTNLLLRHRARGLRQPRRFLLERLLLRRERLRFGLKLLPEASELGLQIST